MTRHILTQHLIDVGANPEALRRTANAFRTTPERQVTGNIGEPGCGMCALGVIFHEFGSTEPNWHDALFAIFGAPVRAARIYRPNDDRELLFVDFADVFDAAAEALS